MLTRLTVVIILQYFIIHTSIKSTHVHLKLIQLIYNIYVNKIVKILTKQNLTKIDTQLTTMKKYMNNKWENVNKM